ncbi:hypothetical protein [Kordia jejudonensis]|nr:hypothetical protein [Kordia jejudonensis]
MKNFKINPNADLYRRIVSNTIQIKDATPTNLLQKPLKISHF